MAGKAMVTLEANGGKFKLDNTLYDYGYCDVYNTQFPDIGDDVYGGGQSWELQARDGYTLTSWNSAADGTGTSYSIGEVIPSALLNNNSTVYAIWTEASSGGGGGGNNYATISYDDEVIGTITGNATATLATAGKWIEHDIVIRFDPNGELEVSEGVTMISFTIEGVSYQAEEGMTWAEWCASEYNATVNPFYVSGTIIRRANSSPSWQVAYNNTTGVRASEEIVANTNYQFMPIK